MQVVYAADLARRRIKQLRGNRLRQRVVTLLLVSAHEVVLLLRYHAVKFRDLIGRVLQVGIHRDDDIALGSLEAAVEGRTFAVIAAELDAVYVLRILVVQFFDDIPAVVRGAVIDEDDLIRESVGVHYALDPCV